MMIGRATRLPLVGRDEDLRNLRKHVDRAAGGVPTVVVLSGEGGVGKTRLIDAAADDAGKKGFTILSGSAYRVESGIPYAVFSDALAEMIRGMDRSALMSLTRGADAALAAVMPGLEDQVPKTATEDAAEGALRLRWHMARFLERLVQRGRPPLALVLENLQWADSATIALVHFLVRQLRDARILLLLSVSTTEGAVAGHQALLHDLVAAGAHHLAVQPLDVEGVRDLLRQVFPQSDVMLDRFSRRLHARTLGNAFFVEETLKSLVEGKKRQLTDASWTGWEQADAEVPASIRDAILARLDGLSEPARMVASCAAVFGARVRHAALRDVAALDEGSMIVVAEELGRQRLLADAMEGSDIVYDFTHPLLGETIYASLSRARARELHGRVAAALERERTPRTPRQASQLARHYLHAEPGTSGASALECFMVAGRDASARFADREAARYLMSALDVLQGTGGDAGRELEILPMLARAHQRLGEDDEARRLWHRAVDIARSRGDAATAARALRRIGLSELWAGRPADALQYVQQAVLDARTAGRSDIEARALVAQAMAHQAQGDHERAKALAHDALQLAESVGEPALLARVERALLLLYVLTGPAERAREFGDRLLTHAAESGNRGVGWSAHWAHALLGGFTGDTAGAREHVERARSLALELQSPVMLAASDEIAIEYASVTGDWARALQLADEAIPIARAVAPRTILPRLLVWSGLVRLNQNELTRAKEQFDESWELSGAGSPHEARRDVHSVITAHIGRASWSLCERDWESALATAERGLRIADQHSYVVWAIHRLLPIVAEAALFLQDFPRVERVARRLREDSARLGHRVGMAWATAAEALLVRLRDGGQGAAGRLLAAAVELESVPFRFHAARLRRNAAQLLAADDARAAAAAELRTAHDVFLELGAEFELRGTRDQMRALGMRPPLRTIAPGGVLSGRELEIARLVAHRKANKEIARDLDLSARTVSTHLTNIFAKLDVTSRGELTDVVRRDYSDQDGG